MVQLLFVVKCVDNVRRFSSVRDVQEKRQAPSDTVDDTASSACSDFTNDWSPCLYSVEGETVYDFAWYVADLAESYYRRRKCRPSPLL